jgi:protein-S-isoprenylcysteine O-methyltransferase Ste14
MIFGFEKEDSVEKTAEIDLKALKKLAVGRFLMLFPILGACFFLPAWSLKYWEGWLYMIAIAVPVAFFGIHLFRTDPKLLERRMKTREKRKEQRLVLKLSLFFYPFIFVLPGFDKRFGWSRVPPTVELIALGGVLFGYLMITAVFRANSYASRVVEVERGQRVVSTGPYAVVRHPMYSAQMILYLFTPVALGSYWAVIPAVLFPLVFVLRILDEEKELTERLEGYADYKRKVKYRLIPRLW